MKNDPWKNLASVAQTSKRSNAQDEAPFGFATRVVAQWQSSKFPEGNGWERFGWRALAGAFAVATICVALNFESLVDWRQESQGVAALTAAEVLL